MSEELTFDPLPTDTEPVEPVEDAEPVEPTEDAEPVEDAEPTEPVEDEEEEEEEEGEISPVYKRNETFQEEPEEDETVPESVEEPEPVQEIEESDTLTANQKIDLLISILKDYSNAKGISYLQNKLKDLE